MSRELIIQWINQASELKPGESTYIPCNDKQTMLNMLRDIKKELEIFKEISAVDGNQLRVFKRVAKGAFWVVIEKIATNPLVAFKKEADGTVTRISATDPERDRRILLMFQDGFTIDQIEFIEGDPLTPEDLQKIGAQSE